MLYNPDAAPNSLHTSPLMGPGVSRVSAWEIHPVTAMELEDEVLDEQATLGNDGAVHEDRVTGANCSAYEDRVTGANCSAYARSNTSSSAP
jgi:hypothetical protein